MGEFESFQLKSTVPKSDARGSYDYVKQGRAGNPDKKTVHPFAYPLSRAFRFPIGFAMRLKRKDPRAWRELKEEARHRGYRGIYKVCRNRGGFNCKGPRRKIMLMLGQIDTSWRGLETIIERFEV